MTTADKKYEVLRFGHEQEPVVVIDNFAPDPDALKAQAARLPFQTDGPFYPGVRAPADPAYLQPVVPLLTRVLETEFSLTKGTDLHGCSYSLVTTKPEDLQPIQSLPHFDGTDNKIIALLHFLCDAPNGGTAFYRHNETGYETLSAERITGYNAALHRYADSHGLPPRNYFTAGTDQFERIGHVDARYNRCLIYRGHTLHSGDIPKNLPFDSAPLTGRLTLNSFLFGK